MTQCIIKHIIPELWQNLPTLKIPLHLFPAGLKHLSQNIKAPETQRELCQEKRALLIVRHFTFEHLLHTGHAVVHVQVSTQIEECPALIVPQSVYQVIDRLKLMLV